MFKDEMYQELRSGLELYVRARLDETRDPWEKIQKESILCEFLRNEKDGDICLVIRRHRLALKEAEKTGIESKYERELEGYRKSVLEHLKRNPKLMAEFKGQSIDCRELAQIDELATMLAARKESRRKDPYIALQETYLDYRLGKLEEQAVLEKAREVFGANRKYRVRKWCKEILKSGCSVSEAGLQGVGVELIAEELSEAILVAQAKAFLYDAGYPYDTRKDDETVTVKNTGRRKDQVMDLVDLYFEKRGSTTMDKGIALSGGQKADYRSSEFKEQCLSVYDVLQEEGRDDVCLPLYIDVNTGAGIYIVGKKRFHNDFLIDSGRKWLEEGKEGWEKFICHFCCLYWGDIRKWEDLYAGFPVTIMVDGAYGNDIKAVIDEYKAGLKSHFDTFKAINNYCPEGLDERYWMFFKEEKDKIDEISTEEWKRTRDKELKERKQKHCGRQLINCQKERRLI